MRLILLTILSLLFPALPSAFAFSPELKENLQTLIDGGQKKGVYEQSILLVGHGESSNEFKAIFASNNSPESSFSLATGGATLDMRFDLASLTKVISTATLALRLNEEGRFMIGNDELLMLRHRTGIRSGAPDSYLAYPLAKFLNEIWKLLPLPVTDHDFLYSDLNFILLGKKIEAATGLTLDTLFKTEVAEPLGMKSATYLPRDPEAKVACLDCVPINAKELPGHVHDPAARKLGGVAGSAGVFASARDLEIYARMMLAKGEVRDSFDQNSRFLRTETIDEMTSSAGLKEGQMRGLGWEIDTTDYDYIRGDRFPIGGFGHTGYTGTSIWIDPGTSTYLIFLSNLTYYMGDGTGRGDLDDLKIIRNKIATLIAEDLGLDKQPHIPVIKFARKNLPNFRARRRR